MAKPTAPRKTKLTDSERTKILGALLLRSNEGQLKRGDLSAVAAAEGIDPSTISRLWTRAKAEMARTGYYTSPSRRGRSGRPASDHSQMLERLRGVDVEERSTVRSAATACGMPPTTLFEQLRQGKLRKFTSVVKPVLTEANKHQRLQFSLSPIQHDTMLFDSMVDTVHVDEKLFYITQPTRRFFPLPDEATPVRRLRSKRYITKVMFLSAVGRPRYDPATQHVFDGKLGIWPFVERVPAQRSSARRPAGTVVTKEVSVTKASYRSMLISNLLPALRSRWPGATNDTPIFIQQDNAPAHIAADDAAFAEATAASECNVALRNQPPNSPDLNCNDLGIFSAIQARQRKKRARTLDELIAAVVEAYWELPPRTINAAFLSLQCSMDDCIAQGGDNNHKPRHMKKTKLEREGRLPVLIRCCSRAEEIIIQPTVVLYPPGQCDLVVRAVVKHPLIKREAQQHHFKTHTRTHATSPPPRHPSSACTMARGRAKRNINEVLVGYRTGKGKKARGSRYKWLLEYEVKFGLRPNRNASNVVVEATCRFCSAFGRESKVDMKNPFAEADILSTKAPRKKTKRVYVFRKSFRSDNIQTRLRLEHPRQWEQYQAAIDTVRTTFFRRDISIASFLPSALDFHFRVHKGIVETIKKLYCDSVDDAPGGFDELEDGSCLIHVAKRDQFEVVVKCVTAAVSYRSIEKMFVIFGEALKNQKLMVPNRDSIQQYIRYVLALNLTAIDVLLRRSWRFSIIVDGATHSSRGYLDVRLAFDVLRKLCDLHFLAIPTGDLAHTGVNYGELVLETLKSVVGSKVLLKSIGTATDGAANMLGCRRGFVSRVRTACGAIGGCGIVANWCGSHQLNLVIGDFLSVLDDFIDFRSVLGKEVSFTHTHTIVQQRIGRSCPTYAITRRDSIHDSCKFLSTYYLELIQLQKEKGRDVSSPSWWLCLFFVADFTQALKICFAKLQYKHVIIVEQYRALQELFATIQVRFEENSEGGTPVISELKLEREIFAASAFQGIATAHCLPKNNSS